VFTLRRVATRLPEHSDYRYLVASDPTWRAEDIVQAYTLRGLVETVLEDLKVYEGGGQSTKQPGVEGSRSVLTLSLLCDHGLFLHPQQSACLAANQPLFTPGSLQRPLRVTALTQGLKHEFLEGEIKKESLKTKISQLTDVLSTLFPLSPSSKHLNGRCLGRLESTPSLRYRVQCLTTPS